MSDDPRDLIVRWLFTAPAEPHPSRIDLRRADGAVLVERISRGSVPAFIELFDRTSGAVCARTAARLPSSGQVGEVLAACYLEVWWLAKCRSAPDVDVRDWILDIVRRRCADACRQTPRPDDCAAVLVPRPSYAELELAMLLKRPVDGLIRP